MEPTLECSGIQPPSVAWLPSVLPLPLGQPQPPHKLGQAGGTTIFGNTHTDMMEKKTPQPHGAYSLQSALHTSRRDDGLEEKIGYLCK